MIKILIIYIAGTYYKDIFSLSNKSCLVKYFIKIKFAKNTLIVHFTNILHNLRQSTNNSLAYKLLQTYCL